MTTSQSDQSDQLAQRNAMRALWQWKWYVVAWVALVVIGIQIYVANATRLYRVSAILAPASKAGSGAQLGGIANQFQGLAAIAGIDLQGQDNTAISLATLKGTEFTLDFIHDLKIAPQLFPDRWDDRKNKWKLPAPTDLQVLKVFDSSIRQIIEDKQTGLITLQITWRDPNTAALWANQMIIRLNEKMRLQAKEESERSLAYLDEELKKTASVETGQAISSLIESQMRDVMLANVRKDYAYVIVDPAIVPQEKDFVWPRRVMLTTVAIVLAGVVSVFFVLLWENAPRLRKIR